MFNNINLSIVKSLDIDYNGGLWMGIYNYGIVYLDSIKINLRVYNN